MSTERGGVLNPEGIRRHVERKMFVNYGDGRKCGDDRDKQKIAEAIFGADLGYVFGTQAALRQFNVFESNTEEEAINQTFEIVADGGLNYIHTDDGFSFNKDPYIGGCGANKVARKHKQEFGLIDTDFTALDNCIQNRQNRLQQAVYTGGHSAQGVIRLWGDGHGIVSNDSLNQSSVFVLTPDLILQRIQKIATELADVYGINQKQLFNQIVSHCKNHSKIISGELAKGLPVFDVIIDGVNGAIKVTKVK